MKSLIQDLSPILQQQRKIDSSLCVVKNYSQKVQEGGDGYFIIEGRNNTKAIAFNKQDQITAEFYQNKKLVDMKYNVAVNGSLAKISFKPVDGSYNTQIFF